MCVPQPSEFGAVGLSVGDNGALGKYTSSRKVETQQQLFDSSSESCSEINFYQKPSTQTFLGHCHAFFFNLNGERTRDEAVRMSTGDRRRKKGLLTQGQCHSSETKKFLYFSLLYTVFTDPALGDS